MIPVMHSAPKLRGFTLTRHPCLGSAAAILAYVHITSIKAPQQKIPKGEYEETNRYRGPVEIFWKYF
ncbi:MAG: hypothetical protein PHO30_05005 [Candidatus Omnitrophica bacterium]|nr:hypothetical protein [Candidatus Omnitrophota bacterium]